MVSVIHLGSRPLSHSCLRLMDEYDEIEVKGVCTYLPDHDGWWEGSLHEIATNLGYPVIQEDDIFDIEVDFLISTLYYNILGRELLTHPTYGGLNLHQAELPRYRGSNIFSHAILNATEDDYYQYGTTLHFMQEEVDAGDIVERRFVTIEPDDTAKSLYLKTEQQSIELFENMLPKIASAEVTEMRTPQEGFDSPQYFYSKDSLDGLKYIPQEELNELSPSRLHDRIRAVEFPPFKPAYTKIGANEIFLTTQEYGDPSSLLSK